MKKIIQFFVGILVLIGVLILGKNMIAKAAIENGVRVVTGLPLKMRDFDFSLLKSFVGIKELKLYNPAGFKDPVMMDLPEAYVNYELAPLLKGSVHIEEIRLHLREFVVVRDERGKLNVDTLRPVQTQKRQAKAPAQRPAAKAPKMQIDNLSLQIEKVIFKDYSKGTPPTIREFNLNMNERHQNIGNLNVVVSLIVMKVMMQTPLAGLTDFDTAALQKRVTNALADSRKLAAKMAAEGTSRAVNYLAETDFKGATDTVQDTAKEITGDLKGVASNLKNKFQNPFSKER